MKRLVPFHSIAHTHIRTYPKYPCVTWALLSFRFEQFSLLNDGNTAQSAYACVQLNGVYVDVNDTYRQRHGIARATETGSETTGGYAY